MVYCKCKLKILPGIPAQLSPKNSSAAIWCLIFVAQPYNNFKRGLLLAGFSLWTTDSLGSITASSEPVSRAARAASVNTLFLSIMTQNIQLGFFGEIPSHMVCEGSEGVTGRSWRHRVLPNRDLHSINSLSGSPAWAA